MKTMKHDDESHPDTGIDPEVTAHYRAMADERTPGALDRTVLQQAAAAARADRPSAIFRGWLRPFSFVAAGALSVAVVIDMQNPELPSAPAEPVPAIGASLADAAPAEGPSAAEANAALRREKATAPAAIAKTATPDTVGEQSAAIAREVDAAAEQLGDAGVQALQSATLQAPGARQQADADAADTPCSGEQRASRESWWRCIETLRANGFDGTADNELAAYGQRFGRGQSDPDRR